MQTFRRRNRLKGFGLVDAFVGVLILLAAAVGFSYAFQSITTLSFKQVDRVHTLLKESDGSVLEKNL